MRGPQRPRLHAQTFPASCSEARRGGWGYGRLARLPRGEPGRLSPQAITEPFDAEPRGADTLVRESPKAQRAITRISTSALTGEGIPALRAAILQHVAGDSATQLETGFLTSVRHQRLVDEALTALDAATNAVAAQVPHEMLLLDLYGALRPLDEITGATTSDDILNLIFGTFCIGK